MQNVVLLNQQLAPLKDIPSNKIGSRNLQANFLRETSLWQDLVSDVVIVIFLIRRDDTLSCQL